MIHTCKYKLYFTPDLVSKVSVRPKIYGEMPPSPPASRRIFAPGKQIKSRKCKAL